MSAIFSPYDPLNPVHRLPPQCPAASVTDEVTLVALRCLFAHVDANNNFSDPEKIKTRSAALTAPRVDQRDTDVVAIARQWIARYQDLGGTNAVITLDLYPEPRSSIGLNERLSEAQRDACKLLITQMARTHPRIDKVCLVDFTRRVIACNASFNYSANTVAKWVPEALSRV